MAEGLRSPSCLEVFESEFRIEKEGSSVGRGAIYKLIILLKLLPRRVNADSKIACCILLELLKMPEK